MVNPSSIKGGVKIALKISILLIEGIQKYRSLKNKRTIGENTNQT